MMATIPLLGEMAALLAACCWACSATVWSLAGRRIGAVAVACLRVTLATLILAAVHWPVYGSAVPLEMPSEAVWMLLVSGALGTGMGDLLFFHGLVLIGPRLGMTIVALMPFVAAGVAYVTPLRETLGLWAGLGMMLTVGGVIWVVTEQRGRNAWQGPPGRHKSGIALCLTGTILVGGAFVLAKMGLKAGPTGSTSALSATLVRLAAATVVTWTAAGLMGRLPAVARSLGQRRPMMLVALGAAIGPVLGIWLSLVALGRTAETGVATALLVTSPILLIPIAYFVYGDRPTARTVLGTLAAVGGVAVLLLRDRLPS